LYFHFLFLDDEEYHNQASVEAACDSADILFDLDEKKKHNISYNSRDYPVLSMNLSLKTADRLISLVRMMKSNECYETNGGMTEDEVLIDQTRNWIMKDSYKKLVHKIMEKDVDVDMKEMFVADTSFRVKRAKGFKWVFYYCARGGGGMAFDLMFQKESDLQDSYVFRPKIMIKSSSPCCVQCFKVYGHLFFWCSFLFLVFLLKFAFF
jgi:hypothetical protein